MKKKLLLVPAMAAALCVALFAAGCNSGPSAEEQIREIATAELDVIKDTESDEYQDFVEGAVEDLGDLSSVGVDSEEVVKSMIEGYDYEIGDITVDEDSGEAEVEVTITLKDMSSFQTDLYDAVEANADQLATAADYDELYAMYNEIVMDLVDSAELKDSDITLTFSQNDDGEWEADESDIPNYILNSCLM